MWNRWKEECDWSCETKTVSEVEEHLEKGKSYSAKKLTDNTFAFIIKTQYHGPISTLLPPFLIDSCMLYPHRAFSSLPIAMKLEYELKCVSVYIGIGKIVSLTILDNCPVGYQSSNLFQLLFIPVVAKKGSWCVLRIRVISVPTF